VGVVPGVEVTTREGHLLVLFVEERPPALRPLLWTADWVREHGGLCIAPHPCTRWTYSLSAGALISATAQLAGIEVLNASLAGRASRPRALTLACAHGLAQIGGSDAHMMAMVGLARTRFPGRSASDLRQAIEGRRTTAEGRFATPGEMAAEAIPQLARSMIHLPLRRVLRFARANVRSDLSRALRSRR
jgi:predicted metal-dependent phosphoesterase TrpH